MASYNRVIMMGNLTRDPVLRYLPSQMAVVDFGLAVNHRFRTKSGEDRDEVCFIDCSAFGKQAEVINQYCQKGRPLLVEGRLKYDTWDDKQGGGKRSKHAIVIENFQLLGGRDAGGGGGGGAGRSPDDSPQDDSRPQRPQGRPANGRPTPQPPQDPPFPEDQQFQDDDIPF
ncbi:MAG: single-stranded DNA-binding protein [Phycisphaerales bacterium]|nr:single-stranded DNA-binding protein [Phycisphaerales bacterium]